MTPEEQEVYAWMGISPLVLSTQEVKNPKSAIVSVVLPGEAPPAEVADSGNGEQPDSLMDEDEADIEEAETHEPEPVEEIAAAAEEVEAAPEEEAPINRRRRRRSSANGGD